ncbi:MAG: alpha/beta hydrolase family protein [Sphingobacteriaceae bacterium]
MIQKQNYILPGAKGRPMLMDLTFDDAVPPASLIIFVHGFKGFKDWGTHDLVANYFAKSGFRFLKFNFSHNGTTPDSPVDFTDLMAFADNTFSIELEDLNRLIDFACSGSVFPAAKSLFLIGHSMGGGISIIQTLEDKRITKLITWAAVANFRNLWPEKEEAQWKISGIKYFENARTRQEMPVKSGILDDLERNTIRLDIMAASRQIKQPWLIVHGTEDDAVPLDQAKKLHELNEASTLMIVTNANHVFGGTHPYAEKTLPMNLKQICEESVAFLKS